MIKDIQGCRVPIESTLFPPLLPLLLCLLVALQGNIWRLLCRGRLKSIMQHYFMSSQAIYWIFLSHA